MKSFQLFSIALTGTLLSLNAWAAPRTTSSPAINVKVINQELTQVLQQYNNKKSILKGVLTAASVDTTRATSLGGYAVAVKDGQVKAKLIASFDYSYLEGATQPVLGFDANLAAPNGGMKQILVNFGIQQSKINRFFTDSQTQLQQITQSLLHQYGNAVTVKALVDSVRKDKLNNYIAENLSIRASVDLTKLPANIKPDQVILTDVQAHFSINLTNGAQLSAKVALNPGYSDFKENQNGLKEYLEELQKNNPDAINALSNYAQMANDFMNAATGLQQQSNGSAANLFYGTELFPIGL